MDKKYKLKGGSIELRDGMEICYTEEPIEGIKVHTTCIFEESLIPYLLKKKIIEELPNSFINQFFTLDNLILKRYYSSLGIEIQYRDFVEMLAYIYIKSPVVVYDALLMYSAKLLNKSYKIDITKSPVVYYINKISNRIVRKDSSELPKDFFKAYAAFSSYDKANSIRKLLKDMGEDIYGKQED